MSAPDAVKLAVSPLQIAEGDASALTLGKGFTVTVTLDVPVHPAALGPVTV